MFQYYFLQVVDEFGLEIFLEMAHICIYHPKDPMFVLLHELY